MKNKIIIALLTLLSLSSFAQYSVGGGLSLYNSLRYQKDWNPGFHVYGEFPNSESNTFYLRATIYKPVVLEYFQEVYNPETATFSNELFLESKNNVFSVDGGTRHYFINTYDVGGAIYLGGSLKASVNTYSDRYTNPTTAQPNAKAFAIVGSVLGYVGYKYQLPYRSAIYVDAGLDLRLLTINPSYYLPGLYFTMNVGYRFDWY